MSNLPDNIPSPVFLRHDFLGTPHGLLFAVVASGCENGRALCFLRYFRRDDCLEKLNTEEANRLLRERWPEHLYHSPLRDADLHGVRPTDVARHYRPRERAAELASPAEDVVPRPTGGDRNLEATAGRLLQQFARRGVPLQMMGVTGSLLVGAHGEDSDIDLVIYGREHFQQARAMLARLQEDGVFDALSAPDWQRSYRRRGCSLSLEEYIWHERRKQNKAIFENTKFDIAQANSSPEPPPAPCRKLGPATATASIVADEDVFAFPARWRIDDPDIDEVVSYTTTYTGQAFLGETIEARGTLEESSDGTKRLVVGSSREAPGEFIRVLN